MRTWVGVELSRDTSTMEILERWPRLLGSIGRAISIMPAVIRPFVGHVVHYVMQRQVFTPLYCKLDPIAQQYLNKRHHPAAGRGDEYGSYIDYYIREANKFVDGEEVLHASAISTSIIALSFAGGASTNVVATQAMYNILSYQASANPIEQLRAEIERSAKGADAVPWTWERLESLSLLTSIVFETYRLHGLDQIPHGRTLKELITTEDGLELAAGTMVGIPYFSANRDPVRWEKLDIFDPYRHIEAALCPSRSIASENDSESMKARAKTCRNCSDGQRSAASYSEHYMSFGYGTTACPGRWLSTALVKMIVMHLVMRYDVQYLDSPPRPLYVNTFRIASPSLKVRVRKRS